MLEMTGSGALGRVPVRTVVRRWWRSIDRPTLYAVLGLMAVGVILCLAAGPIAALRKGIENPLHFVERQLVFLVPTMIALVGVSVLPAITARRLGVLTAVGAFVLMVATLFIGPEIKGATRWLSLPGFSLQPSEFFKPGFIVAAAWFLAESRRSPGFPGGALAMGLYGAGASVLILQPDYGQLLLLTAIWGVMFFVAGWSWMWIGGLGAGIAGALAFGYSFAPHVRSRIDRFLSPETGDTYQVDRSIEAISGGGLFGHDLNHAEGVKRSLPDAHTDFVFAVAGEEFGFILCAVILGIFAAIALRAFTAAQRAESLFLRCVITGLAAQLAFQAIINIGVSLAVLPAKGMTLPFISYGGSSLVASGLTAGLLLCFMRKRA